MATNRGRRPRKRIGRASWGRGGRGEIPRAKSMVVWGFPSLLDESLVVQETGATKHRQVTGPACKSFAPEAEPKWIRRKAAGGGGSGASPRSHGWCSPGTSRSAGQADGREFGNKSEIRELDRTEYLEGGSPGSSSTEEVEGSRRLDKIEKDRQAGRSFRRKGMLVQG
jgi:hypothetical protein